MAFLDIIKFVGIITVLLVFGGLSWEHIARKNESTFKPSTAMWKVVPIAEDVWYWCGVQAARISSFLTFLKDLLHNVWTWIKDFFSGFWITVSDLFTPIFKFLFSWTYFFEGYAEKAREYAYPALIGVGSIVLIFILVCVVTWLLTKYEYIDACYSPVHLFLDWWYSAPVPDNNGAGGAGGAGGAAVGAGVASTGSSGRSARTTRQIRD